MRNIEEYTKQYLDNDNEFEKIQVKYRRKKVIEVLKRYKHNNILEIGCGMEPLFKFFDDFDLMTIVEPSSKFVDNAKKEIKIGNYANIQIIKGFFEEKVDELKKLEYDYIILSGLLHEVERPSDLLRGIKGG